MTKQVLKAPTILKTYVLKEPVEYGDEKVYQLEFRAMKTKDHLIIEKNHKGAGQIEISCAYLQLLCEQPGYVIENLSHEDFMTCQRIVLDFLDSGPKTTTKT